MSGISASLKNGYEEPSGSLQAAAREWCLTTPKEGFCGAIRKLARRWQ